MPSCQDGSMGCEIPPNSLIFSFANMMERACEILEVHSAVVAEARDTCGH
ncbi:rCG48198 [Rattus norvegicus]|uniref:RCG48198 n=1 Tax=Rattus norvegicus TaxID=10116 RepID=A6HX70_RAT|nr:rCG48198 [Rattus norvegicus]